MRKTTSLAGAMSKKAAVLAPPPEETKPADPTVIRTLTVRLPEPVHEQLRELSYHTRKSQHDLLLEGANLMFARYGKPEIAPTRR